MKRAQIVDCLVDLMQDHDKVEKIRQILQAAKGDVNRDKYAERYLDTIEEVIRWTHT